MSRKLPSLNALRAFEAAARLGGVSLAARELHVTHGAVSRQIRSLEEDLGQALFSRQGRSLLPTAAGQRLRESCTSCFDQLGETWTALRQAGNQAPLVLGCPGSLIARWVIPRLERMGRELPTLKLHFVVQDEPFSAPLSGVDAAFLLGSPPWPKTWDVDELAPERIGPVLSPRYSSASRLIDHPASALIGEALLHTESRPQAWPEWAAAAGLDPAQLQPAQGFPHLYHLLEAAVAGLGVGIAPAPLVADDIAAGKLLAPWGFQPTSASWVLATPQRRHRSQTESLASWLRLELAK